MGGSSNLEFRKIKSLDFLYEINENGTVFRNAKSKKQSRIKLDNHGCYCTFCRYKGKPKRVMVHRAVAECWLGPCPDGMEAGHIDRDSRNNDYRNLRYVAKSEQMKNRDHSNISRTGSKNLEIARSLKAKPVRIHNGEESRTFPSYADCSRYLAERYGKTFEHMRHNLKRKRSHIYDFDIEYLLNAETIHDGSTEQEIVHESDLTGNYTTAFNPGKQAETEARVKHNQKEA